MVTATQIYNSDQLPQGEIYQLYEQDRAQSIAAICGEICNGPGLREAVVVSWLKGHAWLLADLHNPNIMRDQNDAQTIINALIGPFTPAAYIKLQWLQAQVADAKAWRSSGKHTIRKKWHDGDEGAIHSEIPMKISIPFRTALPRDFKVAGCCVVPADCIQPVASGVRQITW